jgi:glycosyltransferase involved in cell wall biosynthesis
MLNQFCISIIVPVYNAESHIDTCLNSLLKQDFNKKFEIILINDGSTDNSINLIKKYEIPDLQLYSLTKNSGPSAARNLGLKKAKGRYVFFLDVDDTIAPNILTTLYKIADETDYDMVFCDREWIENSRNQKTDIFVYPTEQTFENSDFIQAMEERFYNPTYPLGLFVLNGRLIKRSIITNNNLLFEEKLRYLEDEIFMWNILAFIRSARYIRKQLYSYHVHHNVKTALSEVLNRGFQLSNFILAKNNIQNCLKERGFLTQEIEKIADQAFIYFIISSLVSYSRSMILGKVELENGLKYRRKMIDGILADPEVSKAIQNYSRSQKENSWIPRAIAWRSHKLLEFACSRRAKEILRIRRKRWLL